MSERQQRFRLGLFVIFTLGMLGVLVILFGGGPEWFKKTNEYTIFFSDAPGIARGTPVRKSGVKVGEVTSITLDDASGQVRVVVNLDPKFTPRTSDEPTVTRGLLAGDTAIDFIPRTPDKPQHGEPIPPGTAMQGVSPFNAKLLLDQATGVIPESQKTLEQVRRSLEALEKISPQIEATIIDVGALAKASRELIPELKRTNDNLRDLLGGEETGLALKNLGPELKKTNDEIRYFLKTSSFWIEEAGVMLKKNEPLLAKALNSFAATSDKAQELFNDENQKNLAETLRNSREASARFERVMLGAEDLMKDGKSAMKTFNSTMGQAEQAISELRQATKPLAERAGRIVENIETGSDLFSKTMLDARELIKAVGRSEGAFQKFITDPSLYNNINDMTAGFGKIMPRLDRILRDLEVFADKIARHPEALGIGGAVRPSAGLKESPLGPPRPRP